MSHFDLLYSMKSEFERTVRSGDLIAAIFADHPELESFRVDVTSEYDDNNYSDYSRTTKVNDWHIDYEGNYENEEDDPEAPKASVRAVVACMEVAHQIKAEWGYGDHTFERSEFPSPRDPKEILAAPGLSCIVSLAKGEKVPTNVLMECESQWVLRHAELHGRFPPEDEFALFAREGWMWISKEYAKKFGPLSDKTLNYYILSLTSDCDEYKALQEYLHWVKAA